MIGYGDRARTQCEVVRLFRETHPDLPPLNQGTISKIEAQYREMGHVRKVPSKRQAVVDDDTKLNLLLALEENPITSARQLARDINCLQATYCDGFIGAPSLGVQSVEATLRGDVGDIWFLIELQRLRLVAYTSGRRIPPRLIFIKKHLGSELVDGYIVVISDPKNPQSTNNFSKFFCVNDPATVVHDKQFALNVPIDRSLILSDPDFSAAIKWDHPFLSSNLKIITQKFIAFKKADEMQLQLIRNSN
ncbi:hypothetical protein NQ318_019418 [Aromia moschata]|uniref:DUF4817 domain-containing protein n=1 Tax=Aromia moschata TaxID=1265417 RepID=A0AAV8XK73_9CUCU|nr:hypothetical protein NQ318_019418 [Aromia moschata]